MGHFTGQLKTKPCPFCHRTTLHEEVTEQEVSTAKILGGLATAGWSLPFTGFKKERKRDVCAACGTVN